MSLGMPAACYGDHDPPWLACWLAGMDSARKLFLKKKSLMISHWFPQVLLGGFSFLLWLFSYFFNEWLVKKPLNNFDNCVDHFGPVWTSPDFSQPILQFSLGFTFLHNSGWPRFMRNGFRWNWFRFVSVPAHTGSHQKPVPVHTGSLEVHKNKTE